MKNIKITLEIDDKHSVVEIPKGTSAEGILECFISILGNFGYDYQTISRAIMRMGKAYSKYIKHG